MEMEHVLALTIVCWTLVALAEIYYKNKNRR